MPALEELDFNPEDSTWPRTIGVISMIYAIGGMLCASSMAAWTFFSEMLIRMGGIDAEVPDQIKIQAVVMGALSVPLGIIMLTGAIGLLRRRPSGVTWLKRWVVLRLILLLVSLGVAIMTMPAQVQFQMEMLEQQNRMLRDAGRESQVREMSEEQLWRRVQISTVAFTGVLAIYPAFLGFFLSRKRVGLETEHWGEQVT